MKSFANAYGVRNVHLHDCVFEGEAGRLVHIVGDSRQPVDGVVLENVRVGKVSLQDIVENAVNVKEKR